jgi:hypothetical protein
MFNFVVQICDVTPHFHLNFYWTLSIRMEWTHSPNVSLYCMFYKWDKLYRISFSVCFSIQTEHVNFLCG